MLTVLKLVAIGIGTIGIGFTIKKIKKVEDSKVEEQLVEYDVMVDLEPTLMKKCSLKIKKICDNYGKSIAIGLALLVVASIGVLLANNSSINGRSEPSLGSVDTLRSDEAVQAVNLSEHYDYEVVLTYNDIEDENVIEVEQEAVLTVQSEFREDCNAYELTLSLYHPNNSFEDCREWEAFEQIENEFFADMAIYGLTSEDFLFPSDVNYIEVYGVEDWKIENERI